MWATFSSTYVSVDFVSADFFATVRFEFPCCDSKQLKLEYICSMCHVTRGMSALKLGMIYHVVQHKVLQLTGADILNCCKSTGGRAAFCDGSRG
jgi:hypothetical protein